VWTPIVEPAYWTINLINIRKVRFDEKGKETSEFEKEKKNKFCPEGCKTIIDTGTYLIYGPGEKILSLLDGLSLDSCKDKQKLPDLAFELQGESKEGLKKSIELILTPDDYVLHFQVDGEDDCVIGIVPDNLDTGYTIGQVFLKAYYTVFDRDNARIGKFSF
jgi:hypothetical protein